MPPDDIARARPAEGRTISASATAFLSLISIGVKACPPSIDQRCLDGADPVAG